MAGDRFLAERIILAGFGALAGLSGWLLTDALADWLDGTRLQLFLIALAAVFFGDALALLGLIRRRPALLAAAVIALVVAGLTLLASFRFDSVEDFVRRPYAGLAATTLAAVPLPFVIARAGGGGWTHYPSLFLASWDIVVRYAAAWVFTGVVWGVLFLSDTLLQLVGITLIGDLLEKAPVAWTLTGALLGLGLAVIGELSDLVSPYLVLRLLRLLLPPLVVVVAVFVIALPFRGLTDLFGHLSAAGTLIAIAAGAVSLIAISVDQGDEEAAQSRVMRGAARGLSLLVPVLGGLAVWAIVLRVRQYGWTPDRVAAATAAGLALGYGLVHAAAAAFGGRGWMAGLRRGNTAMAIVLIGVAAAWFTPLLDAEAISARSHLARHATGRVEAAKLPLSEMRWAWGRAGAAALTELKARAADGSPAGAELAARIAALEAAESPVDFSAATDGVAARKFREMVVVRPEGRSVPDWLFDRIWEGDAQNWLDACERRDAQGRPGCVLVLGDLLPQTPGEEAILLFRFDGGGVARQGFMEARPGDAFVYTVDPAGDGQVLRDADAVFDQLHAGQFSIGPPAAQALRLDGVDFLVLP